ncbi:hypothetical protein [Actinoplanes sp. NPDC048796]|uniref:hypothetical protein n=1 Tax=Actinoplanes sp. NPDC048796 TaxID=3155640 RepID=UPI0033F78AF6
MSFVVPDACTLPTAEQPPRLAEFDRLFTTALREVTRSDATHARLRLAGPAAPVRDLAARETACCSFFTFTVTTGPGDDVFLDVEVPELHAGVLTALIGAVR